MSVRATVLNGRLIVDQPTELPDGTTLELVLDDQGDDLEPSERAVLDAAISTSLKQAAAGQTAPVGEILEKLRTRSRG